MLLRLLLLVILLLLVYKVIKTAFQDRTWSRGVHDTKESSARRRERIDLDESRIEDADFEEIDE